MTEPQLIVFDFDGTLYPFKDEYFNTIHKAVALSVRELSSNTLDEENAFHMGMESYRSTGLAFRSVCNAFNIDLKVGLETHHRHIHFDLEPDPELIESLEALRESGAHLMILTHASQSFLERKLPMLGLNEIFSPNMRLTHEDYNFAMKSNCSAPFLLAVQRVQQKTGLRFNPRKIWMIEDTHANLKIPHAMGWNTALTHHHRPAPDPATHIHVSAPTVSGLMPALLPKPEAIPALLMLGI
jgi:FMN phosphatase YigB (HAD superfamily)